VPWLTDGVEHLDAALADVAAAGATGVTVLPLHLRPGAREWFMEWLAREHPRLVPRYRRLYGRGSYVPEHYRRWLADRIAPLIRRHGLDRTPARTGRGVPGDDEGEYPAGSMPGSDPDHGVGDRGGDRQAEQLSLL